MGKKVENQCDEDKVKKDKDVISFEEDFEEALRPKGVQAFTPAAVTTWSAGREVGRGLRFASTRSI